MPKNNIKSKIEKILDKLLDKGINQADVLYSLDHNYTQSIRLSNLEELENGQSEYIGVRVFKDARSSLVTTSDLSDDNLDKLVAEGIERAKYMPKDPEQLPADSSLVASKEDLKLDLDSYDPSEIPTSELTDKVNKLESLALKDKNITNSEGASISFSKSKTILAGTNGFYGESKKSSYGMQVVLIGGSGEGMQVGYDYSSTCHYEDLLSPEKLATQAIKKTVDQLGAKKPKTCELPVIFNQETAKRILAEFISAISGEAFVVKATFLQDYLGKVVFPKQINIIDDPLIKRGLGSRVFDLEGLQSRKNVLVEDGRLLQPLLALRAARKLNMQPTANASRSFSSHPHSSISNVYIENGSVAFTDLLGDIKEGFYITDLMGHGGDTVNGNYSIGASGMWIEKGKITYPVQEATISANLLEIFNSMVAATDLEIKTSYSSPSLFVPKITIAGN